MMTRAAAPESVYESFTPLARSVALKLRVYSAPASVVGMLICAMVPAVDYP
jgi:hypothetical protein